MLALYSNLELGITLIAPYVEHATLRALALVSRDVAEVVFPFLFHTLKPVTTSQWGTSEALISLLAGPDRPWRHACFVRNITINVDKLHSSSPHIRIPEDAVAAVIASLPALQNVQINSLFLTDGRRYPYPPRDFEPIAQSLISRTRLCSIRISGQWPGGWTCPTALLGGAGEYARSFGMSISAIRDGAVCAALVGCAARLEHLDLSAAAGGIESEHFEMVAGALPFPQKLKSLKVFLKREKGRNWWQEPSFARLTGLEDLDVRTTSTAADVDHSKDVLAMAFQVASELTVERDCTFHDFCRSHPALKALQIRAGPCAFGTICLPPHIYTLEDAYDVGLLVPAQEEQHLAHAAHLEDSGFWTPEGFARVNRARQVRFVAREGKRVQDWAEGAVAALAKEASLIGEMSRELRSIRWFPYEAGGPDDGEYMCEIAMQHDARERSSQYCARVQRVGGCDAAWQVDFKQPVHSFH